MNIATEKLKALTRRHFLSSCQVGLGGMALASLMGPDATAALPMSENPLKVKQPHHAPKAKSVIYVHLAGSPSQLDLFDYKPLLVEMHEKPCPKEYIEGQRFAFIKGHPQLLGTPHKFAQYGAAGQWMSNLLPHLSGVVDEMAIVRSMNTNQFNHAPAQLYIHTGMQRIGWPSMGSWITYGLGSENQDLPGFVVFVSGNKAPSAGKTVWGSGFLPTVYQGVQCRTQGDPVLYVSNPQGMNRAGRRRSLDAMRDLNEMQVKEFGDPETLTRIAQYELAYRMQVAVPEVMDISKETQKPRSICTARRRPGRRSPTTACSPAGSWSAACASSSLFDWGWDSHGTAQARRHHAAASPRSARRPTNHGRPPQGLETARHARRNADRLGRRVRPHVDEMKNATARSFWDGTTIHTPSPCGWPVAASSPASPTARPTSWAISPPRTK